MTGDAYEPKTASAWQRKVNFSVGDEPKSASEMLGVTKMAPDRERFEDPFLVPKCVFKLALLTQRRVS